MRRLIVSLALALVLVASFAVPAFAATTADVTVTATPAFVGIENSPDNFNFETVVANTDEDTTETYFTLTNVSNVAVNTTIACTVWSGTRSWAYGAAGADTGQLEFTFDGSSYTVVPAPPASAVTFKDDIAAYGTQSWGLQLDTPTSFTHGYQQTTTVTITASAG